MHSWILLAGQQHRFGVAARQVIKSLHVLDADVSLNAAPVVGGASDAGIGFVAIKHIPVEDGGLERIRSFVGKDPTHEAALQNNDEVR
jgi:hypothetical protein